MYVGAVLSHKANVCSFKDNKILIRLKTPVFQVVINDKDLTCISKKIEFLLKSDLSGIKARVMGREYEPDELKVIFPAITPSMWISTQFDNGTLESNLEGIAKTIGGKVIFVNEFKSLDDVYALLLKQANYEAAQHKTTIRTYCEKNIDLLNDQIRKFNAEKNALMEMLNEV